MHVVDINIEIVIIVIVIVVVVVNIAVVNTVRIIVAVTVVVTSKPERASSRVNKRVMIVGVGVTLRICTVCVVKSRRCVR